jgi:hypothetical protein
MELIIEVRGGVGLSKKFRHEVEEIIIASDLILVMSQVDFFYGSTLCRRLMSYGDENKRLNAVDNLRYIFSPHIHPLLSKIQFLFRNR